MPTAEWHGTETDKRDRSLLFSATFSNKLLTGTRLRAFCIGGRSGIATKIRYSSNETPCNMPLQVSVPCIPCLVLATFCRAIQWRMRYTDQFNRIVRTPNTYIATLIDTFAKGGFLEISNIFPQNMLLHPCTLNHKGLKYLESHLYRPKCDKWPVTFFSNHAYSYCKKLWRARNNINKKVVRNWKISKIRV